MPFSACLCPVLVQQMLRYLAQPGRNFAAVVEPLQRLVSPQKGFLGQVLRQFLVLTHGIKVMGHNFHIFPAVNIAGKELL